MRLKHVAIGVVLLLVAIICAAVVLVMSIDFNQYKGLIAEQVKQATGRELKIGGNFKLALSLTPSVTVDNLSFANAPGGARPDMVVLKRLEIQMQILPLLSRQIKVDRLVLEGADIWLETDKSGRGNWVFGSDTGAQSVSAPGSTSAAPAALPQVGLVQICNSVVSYHDGMTGKTRSFQIDKLDAATKGGRIELDLAAAIGKAGITAQGSVGAPELLAGGAPYPFDLSLASGATSATLKGAIGDIATMQGLAVDVAAKGRAFSDLSALIGTALPALGPYTVAGKATNVPGGYKVSGVALRLGDSDLGGELSLLLGNRMKVVAALTSQKIDLKDFGVRDAGKGGASTGTSAGPGDGRIFPGTPLPFAALTAADAEVTLAAKQLIRAPVVLSGVKLALSLAAGKLMLKPVSAGIGGGTLVVNLVVDGARTPAPVALDLIQTNVEAGSLLEVLAGTTILSGGRTNAKVAVAGAGNSVRAIMAGLNGKFDYSMGPGNINNGYAKLLLADLFKLLSFGSTGDNSNLKCVVAGFDISRGLATSRKLAVETSGATILGKGTINLATEGLDIHLVPYATAPDLAALAVPMMVGGTMADPNVVPDAAAMAKGAVGAVATAPLTALSTIGSVVGIGGSGSAETGGCGGAAAAAQGQAKPAQQPASPTQNLLNGLGSGAKGAADTLKGLFPLIQPLRRFYKDVAVQKGEGGFEIMLDGRVLRTPAQARFCFASRALAEAIAAEWRDQGEHLRPASLPLTQLANTAVDRVAPGPDPFIGELLAYAGSDLVCYRAERPQRLVERQERRWQPLLDDLAGRHGVRLDVHRGIVPRPQPAKALTGLAAVLTRLDPPRLTALATATGVCGSLVIALALVEGRIGPDEAFELSQLDESYQMEAWGEDREAAARWRSLRRELADIHRFVALGQVED